MKLNGLKVAGRFAEGERLCFELVCPLSDISGLDGKDLVVTEDGDVVEECFGYSISVVNKSEDGTYYVWFARDLSDASKQAIEQLEASVAGLHKEIAEQGGTDPQLKALAVLQVSAMDLSDVPSDEVVKFIDYWPEWAPDRPYRHNDPLTYQERKFRASKDLTSQAAYPPGTAESEYYEVALAPDGIIVWYEVGGEYNMVHAGERRHYPDAEGPVYEALEDTTYAPDAYPQHWALVNEEG